MNIYLMKAKRKIVPPRKEIVGSNTKRDIEYSLDIVQRTLAIMKKGPLDPGMRDLSISRLQSVEERLGERLR